ncbi:MAG TPA: DUF2332 family protein [Acidimicrobiia bacterium]|jgi:hypothetical protein
MSDTGTRLSPERLFRYQAAGCRLPESPSPFYAVLLDALADDCAAGNTSVIGLMDQTPCTVEAAPALRLLGGVQRCVLDGAASQLAAAWPAEGASGDTAVAHDALVALCADPPPALRAALECDPQTNEVGRAAALAPGLAEITRRTGLPIRLLEIGASAALLSRLDHFRYEATNARWGDAASKVRFDYDAALPFDTAPVIVERHACDLRPIDATTADGAQRLLSYCWPDQTVRRNRLRAALEIAAALPVTIDAASADDWLDEHLRPLDGTVTVLMHSIMWQYLPNPVQQRIEQLLRERGAAATARAPLARLAFEPAPEVVHAEVSCTLWPRGERTVLAQSGYHGPPVTWIS